MINIILIAISLSMDAFSLSLVYALNNIGYKKILLTSFMVSLFHFFMPIFGNFFGNIMFNYTLFSPRYIMAIIFLILALDMFISFFSNNKRLRNLNILGIILFAISVSFDSFSIGLGINYIYDNLLLSVSVFCLISFLFTLTGFLIGNYVSKKIGKYSFLFGAVILLCYSIYILTK